MLAQAILMLDIRQVPFGMPAPTIIAPRFANVQLERAGAYTLSLTVDGQVEPLAIFPFTVILVPAQAQPLGQQR